VEFDKGSRETEYINDAQCILFAGKIKNFLSSAFPKSRYWSPNFASFAIFECFSKFNASFLSFSMSQSDVCSQSVRTLTCLLKCQIW